MTMFLIYLSIKQSDKRNFTISYRCLSAKNTSLKVILKKMVYNCNWTTSFYF